MSEGKKVTLAVFGGLVGDLGKGPPTLDEARARLGGAWVGGPDIGAVVRVTGGAQTRVGVVVHATETERDVWIAEGRIQRVASDRIEETQSEDHAALAAHARSHASLREGDAVAYQRPDGTREDGVIAEKLRYGALVGTEDGRVLAVSFRRIAPRSPDASR